MATRKGKGAKKVKVRSNRKGPRLWKASKVISPFAPLGGDGFADAVKALLFSELDCAGLAEDGLVAFIQNNKADGGVDAFLSAAPPRPSELLSRPTVYQFKLSCPSGAALIAELKKAGRTRQLLEAGADYALLVGADANAEAISKMLEREIGRIVRGWTGRCRVFNAGSLAELFRKNSATLCRIVFVDDDIVSWEEWRRERRFRVADFKWTPDEARRALLVHFERGATDGEQKAWRFVGSPGVGKSRLVLEALATRSKAVLVAKRFSSRLGRVVEALRTGWLVVDECSTEDHAELVERFRNSHVRLITIGPALGQRGDPSTHTVEPMSLEDVTRLVPHALPPEVRDLVAQLSGGYPKLLRLYAESALSDPQHVPHGTDELEHALENYLRRGFKTDSLIALELWALPTSASLSELEVLAAHEDFKVTRATLARARTFLEQEGLLGTYGEQAEPRHYVTPLGFAEWLATRVWDDPESILRALGAAPSPLRRACIRRLTQGLSRELRLTLSTLDLERVVGLLDPSATVDLASAVAPAQPRQALELIRRLVHARPEPKVARAALWVLRSTAWFPETFRESLELLAPATDPTTQFMVIDLFGTFLGTTKASADLRVSGLDWLASNHPALAFLAAIEICRVEEARGSGGLPASLDEAWRPSNAEEERAYVANATELLARLVEQDPERLSAATQVIRKLFRRGLGELVKPLFDLVARLRFPIAELARALELVEQHDLASLSPNHVDHQRIVEDLRARLPVATLSDRVAQLVSSTIWFRRTADDPPSGAENVAHELVHCEVPLGTLEAISLEGGPGAYEFGRLCGRLDVARRLVPGQLEHARRTANHQFAIGYFSGWNAAELDSAVREWSQDPALVPLCFSLLHRLGGSDDRAVILIELARTGILSRERLGELYFGAWLSRVSDERSLELLSEIPMPARFLAAEQRFPAASARRAVALDLWFEVGASDLHGMVEHAWLEAADDARASDPVRFNRSMLDWLRESPDGSNSTDALQTVLTRWFAVDPSALPTVLSEFAKDHRLSWVLRDVALPADSVVEAVRWAAAHPENAALVARLSTGTDHLALALLEKMGNNEGVRGALFARASSYLGWGDRSTLIRAQRSHLEALSRQAKSAHAKSWFSAILLSLERDAREAEGLEAAYESRAIPSPYAAE